MKIYVYAVALLVAGAMTVPAAAQTSGSASTGTSPQSMSSDHGKKSSSSGKASEMTTGGTAQLSRSDRLFVEQAAAGGLMEVQLGQLAAQKASDPQVKQFGQRMVDDHSKANDQLKSLAQQKGVNPPSSLPARDQATVDKLSKLSGAEFDKAYMKDMVSDHRHDVRDFQKEANSGQDNEVKTFASQTVPTLQQHLQQAEQVNAAVNGGSKSSKKAGGAK